MDNKLVAKVNAVNKAGQKANEVYQQMVKVFEPLVGREVLKQDGDLLKKIAIPEQPYSNNLQVYRLMDSRYSLAWVVKASENIEGTDTCLYHEVCVYIGELKGKTLEKLCYPPKYRHDYDVKDIQEKQQAVKAAREALDLAQADLYPFDSY